MGSGINGAIPAQGAPVSSSAIRQNFTLAQQFIDGLLSMWAGTAPNNPGLGQDWLNTTVTPYIWSKWDGTQWVQLGIFDPVAHSFRLGTQTLVTYVQPISGATLTAVAGQAVYEIDPAAEIALLAIVLPPTPVDGQTFEITTTQTIDALTVTGGGNSIMGGGPAQLGANGGMAFRFRSTDSTWRRRY